MNNNKNIGRPKVDGKRRNIKIDEETLKLLKSNYKSDNESEVIRNSLKDYSKILDGAELKRIIFNNVKGLEKFLKNLNEYDELSNFSGSLTFTNKEMVDFNIDGFNYEVHEYEIEIICDKIKCLSNNEVEITLHKRDFHKLKNEFMDLAKNKFNYSINSIWNIKSALILEKEYKELMTLIDEYNHLQKEIHNQKEQYYYNYYYDYKKYNFYKEFEVFINKLSNHIKNMPIGEFNMKYEELNKKIISKNMKTRNEELKDTENTIEKEEILIKSKRELLNELNDKITIYQNQVNLIETEKIQPISLEINKLEQEKYEKEEEQKELYESLNYGFFTGEVKQKKSNKIYEIFNEIDEININIQNIKTELETSPIYKLYLKIKKEIDILNSQKKDVSNKIYELERNLNYLYSKINNKEQFKNDKFNLKIPYEILKDLIKKNLEYDDEEMKNIEIKSLAYSNISESIQTLFKDTPKNKTELIESLKSEICLILKEILKALIQLNIIKENEVDVYLDIIYKQFLKEGISIKSLFKTLPISLSEISDDYTINVFFNFKDNSYNDKEFLIDKLEQLDNLEKKYINELPAVKKLEDFIKNIQSLILQSGMFILFLNNSGFFESFFKKEIINLNRLENKIKKKYEDIPNAKIRIKSQSYQIFT